jgi:hypothetical protein
MSRYRYLNEEETSENDIKKTNGILEQLIVINHMQPSIN